MIIERVPRHSTPMAPPSNEERWDAVAALYRLIRNTEGPVKPFIKKENA